MLVLSIIGGAILVFILFMIVQSINKYSYKHFRYEFYNKRNFIIISISYGLIYFGKRGYETALIKHGDILNGQLLMAIGILGIFYALYYNIKRTNFMFGFFMSLFQAMLYLPLAVISFFILLGALAYFSDTKPVYVVNGR
ncbi:MAG: hypothetical protein M0Q94_04295 [Candidatus Cloacimonetes bacterium]|nr:hypothetical protein [Candidatus Cloacimonadota bacterium]